MNCSKCTAPVSPNPWNPHELWCKQCGHVELKQTSPKIETLQDAYSLGHVVAVGKNIAAVEAESVDLVRITAPDEDGEPSEVIAIKPNGEVYLYGVLVDRADPEEMKLVVQALQGWAQQAAVPLWAWEQLCPDCRGKISRREAIRRLRDPQ